MPKYKLYYFPLKGRAEVLRIMFAYAGVEFEDIQVQFKDWGSLKNDMPYKQMPVLEIDGKQYSQQAALARYLAREMGLTGNNSLECLKADEFCEALIDVMKALPWAEADDKKRKEGLDQAFTKHIPPRLVVMEANLVGDYCAGECLTFGDIVFANSADYLTKMRSDVLDATPKLKALYNRVMSIPNIAAYIAKRPDTALGYYQMVM